MGDGGGCHPRDNIAMSWLAKDLDLGYDIFHTIAFSREIQSKNMAKVIAKICKEQDLPCVINGKAYKPLVPYTIGSPSVLLGHYLKEEGIQVYYADTFTGDNPNLELGENCRAVCVMAHDPRSVYLNQANAPKSSLYFTLAKGSTIIDPWRSYRNKDYTIVTYGKSHK
jgi:UDPglucose 6-dehydrogenase